MPAGLRRVLRPRRSMLLAELRDRHLVLSHLRGGQSATLGELDLSGGDPEVHREAVPSTNLFYALRVDGRFRHVRVRAVPRQEKPYPPLVVVTEHQPEFEHRDLDGSLVGFRFPD